LSSGKKAAAPRNRTIFLTRDEKKEYSRRLLRLNEPARLDDILDKTICQDVFEALEYLPDGSVDLLFTDPPYNIEKNFGGVSFRRLSLDEYEEWLEGWLGKVGRLLKPTSSIYICSDWRSSAAVHRVASRYFMVQNRICWEREKGRGAKKNWKNCSEDIWYCTMSQEYTFNIEKVMLKRKVIAPYVNGDGSPRDWAESGGERYRLTHPSNLWTDVTVPFWSMPENTEHPTQKPEKVLAKIILASTNENDVVLDLFAGSGTAAVTARKLGRRYIGVEFNETYCCITEKRHELAAADNSIQGYSEGVFWERNALAGKTTGGRLRSSG